MSTVRELKNQRSALKAKIVDLDAQIDAGNEAGTDVSELTKAYDMAFAQHKSLGASIKRKIAKDALESELETDMHKSADKDEDEDEDKDEDKDEKKSKKSLGQVSIFGIQKSINRLDPVRKAGIYFYTKAVASMPEVGATNAIAKASKAWGEAGELIAKTAVGPLTTTSQPTIVQDVADVVVELLTPESIFRASGARVIAMPNGVKTVFRERLGNTAYYVGEGQSPTVSQVGYDGIQAIWHKLAVLTYITREEMLFPSVNTADFIMRQCGIQLGLKEDITFLTGPSGTTYAPTGLIPQIASGNVLSSTLIGGAVTWQSILNDLASLESVLSGNLIRPPYALAMHPNVVTFLKAVTNGFTVPFRDELSKERPTLNGIPIHTTVQLPTNMGTGVDATQIILFKPDHMMVFDSYQYGLDYSTQGSFVDGGTQVNLFGEQKAAFLATAAHDFKIMHDVSGAVLNAIGWTTTSGITGGKVFYNQSASGTTTLSNS